MFRVSSFFRYLSVVGVVFAMSLTISIAADVTDHTGPIRFYDGGWENIQVNNAIAMYIIKHGLNINVVSIDSKVPDMQKQMVAGTIDVNMEMWRSLMNPWVERQLTDGVITDLGPTYERATQGFYVPTYVIKGDAERGLVAVAPKLKTVSDLKEYAEAFRIGTQELTWLNCIPGWACREPNRVKMTTYGIDNYFKPLELSSEVELNAEILAHYEKGEPFITYYWDPSPMLGRINMTLLEEPAYTEMCMKLMEQAVTDYKPGNKSNRACAYKTVSINKFVTDDLFKSRPKVTQFLQKMMVGTDRVRMLSGYMTGNGVSPQKTARYYLKTYPDEWQKWISPPVIKRVNLALNNE